MSDIHAVHIYDRDSKPDEALPPSSPFFNVDAAVPDVKTKSVNEPLKSNLRCMRAILNPTTGPLSRLARATFIAGILTPTSGAPDFDSCCIVRARELLSEIHQAPWSACGVDLLQSNITTSESNPSIIASINWCMENCGPGYQTNKMSEWLHPLVNWVAPYAALLILCPVGEKERDDDEHESHLGASFPSMKPKNSLGDLLTRWRESQPILSKYLRNAQAILYLIREYLNILGDPASAIWGVLAELESDARLTVSLVKQKGWSRKALIKFVILARQTKFNKHKQGILVNRLIFKRLLVSIESELLDPMQMASRIEKLMAIRNIICSWDQSQNINGLLSRSQKIPRFARFATVPHIDLLECLQDLKYDLEEALSDLPQVQEKQAFGSTVSLIEEMDEVVETHKRAGEALVSELTNLVQNGGIRTEDLSSQSPFSRESDPVIRKFEGGMRVILKARIALVNGVILPTVLALAVTASVFFDAYNQLGDENTAHSLAYGILYSWLLIVVVAGNCYATCVNPGLVKETLGDLVEVSPTTLPFRKRYGNGAMWQAWLEEYLFNAKGEAKSVSLGQNLSDKLSPARFRKPEIFDSWFYLRFFVGQMIGWSCVAVATISAALISYFTPPIGLGCRSFNHLIYFSLAFVLAFLRVFKHMVDHKQKQGANRFFKHVVSVLYKSLVCTNALVLLLGTMFNLAGVFHSCRCKLLFASGSTLVEMGKNTEESIYEARVHWLPVGYVAFTFVWLICTVAIAMRALINAYIEDFWVENGTEMKPKYARVASSA